MTLPGVVPVRPEYGELARDLAWHADTFGVTLRPLAIEDVTVLLAAMDRCDDRVDELAESVDRTDLVARIVARLRGDPVEGVPGDLEAVLAPLHAVARRRGVAEPFAELTRMAFEVSERVRTATDLASYLAGVLRLGRLTTSLTLEVLGPVDIAFDRFFRALGDVGDFVDQLHDVRDDWRRGELSLRPGWALHLALVVGVVRGTLRLLPLHPRPASLLLWGAGHVVRGVLRAHRPGMAPRASLVAW